MLTNVIIDKLKNIQALDYEEIKIVLEFIKDKVNREIIKYDNKTCFESSKAIDELCDRMNIAYYPLSTKELNMSELLHYSGIIGFNTINGPFYVLIDLTYSQFLTDTYPVYINNELNNIKSPGNFISDKNKQDLINNGYVVLSKDNFYDYINSFISSYSTVKNINSEDIVNKAMDLLQKYNIKFVDESLFSKEEEINKQVLS